MIAAQIEAGADVEAGNDTGMTPLHMATWWFHSEADPTAIVMPLDTGVEGNSGRTPWDNVKRDVDLAGT